MTAATMPERPTVTYSPGWQDELPTELREKHQWVNWRYELTDKGKWTKVPTQPHAPDYKASTDNAAQWGSFDDAMLAFDRNETLAGVGFVFATDDVYAGVDLDNCINDDGTLAEWARVWIERLNGYAEISPSRRGVKVWVRGKLPEDGRHINLPGGTAVECYDNTRFFSTTGATFGGFDRIGGDDRSAVIAELIAHFDKIADESKASQNGRHHQNGKAASGARKRARPQTDIAILDKARGAKNAAKFTALYDHGNTDGYASDSEADMALAGLLAFWSDSEDQIQRIMLGSKLYREKWSRKGDDYLLRTIQTALASATEKFGADDPIFVWSGGPTTNKDTTTDTNGAPDNPSTDDRVVIEVCPDQSHVMAQALEVLSRHPDLYQRGGSARHLAMVAVEPPRKADRVRLQDAPTARFVTFTPELIAVLMTEVIRFVGWKKVEGNYVLVGFHPPSWLAKALLARGLYPNFRLVNAIADCPFLLPNGEIHQTAGYEPITGTVLIPGARIDVPDQPTLDDAQRAAGRLRMLVGDFPFSSENDFAVWLSLVLTLVGRPGIAGCCPGFAADANCPGSGKGLLISVAGEIAHGTLPPTADYAADAVEMSKVALSVALAGYRVVLLDNLPEGTTYGNAALDRVLTSGNVDGRILGKSQMAGGLATTTVWVATGNNITPGADSRRRWLPCRLESPVERPETRSGFQHPNILEHVKEHRAAYLRDALVILRAAAVAGWPRNGLGAPLGSFEAWDRVVRSAVAFASGLDCAATQAALGEDDPESVRRVAIVHGFAAMLKATGERSLTCAEVLKRLDDSFGVTGERQDFREAVLSYGTRGAMPSAKSLGYVFRALKGRVVQGKKLVSVRTERKTANIWEVWDV
jgi:hypothetical protein